jgi:hypothetical protein
MKKFLMRLLVAGWVSLPMFAWAGVAGQVANLSGVLSVKRVDGTSRILAVRSEVMEGDLLTTADDTYARIRFVDNAEVVLRPNSQLRVTSYNYSEAQPQSDSALIGLLKGGLRALTGLIGKRNRDAVSFKTPTATIGIRGTEFGALFCENNCLGLMSFSGQPLENGLYLDVADGAIFVQNDAGQQGYAAGQFGYVRDMATPPLVIPRPQGVNVPLPPQISLGGSGVSPGGIGQTGSPECVAQ